MTESSSHNHKGPALPSSATLFLDVFIIYLVNDCGLAAMHDALCSPQNVNGIKYHAKNGHRTQIRVRKPFKCRCGKSYKTSQGLRHHTINFHPPVSTEILRKIQG